MKKFVLYFLAVALIFSLCACNRSKASAPNAARSVDGSSGAADWKQIYLEELLAAQDYAVAADWENYDSDSKYPINLYNAQLADLNFDGSPELFIFDSGASASQGARIFTINSGRAQIIFRGWANSGQINLYRTPGGLAYGFESANGDMDSYEGFFYLTDAATKMDNSFAEAAKFAQFRESYEFDYDEETFEMNHLWSSFIFNGHEVSQDEYFWLKDEVYEGYDELEFPPAILNWNWNWDGSENTIIPFTEAEISAFLNSYQPEGSN